jgi:dihydrofolate reductase
MEKKVVLFIATSLDGYIAKEDGDLDWLSMVDDPPQDYGYSSFTDTVDTVIMGRKSYEKVLSFGIDFPHKNKRCYVLSKTRQGSDENVTFFSGNLMELVSELKQAGGKNIYLDGGSQIVFEFLKYNLVDEAIISVVPILLGAGIPLFKNSNTPRPLKLIKSTSFKSGLGQLHYSLKS